jgi:hypothetical protein
MDDYDDELLIVEHVISISDTSNAAIEPKLASIQEKLVIIYMVDATENFSLKKLRTLNFCVNLKCDAQYSVCK